MGAKIEHGLKASVYGAKPQGNVFRRDLFQERIVREVRRGAGAVAGMEAPIEDPHGIWRRA